MKGYLLDNASSLKRIHFRRSNKNAAVAIAMATKMAITPATAATITICLDGDPCVELSDVFSVTDPDTVELDCPTSGPYPLTKDIKLGFQPKPCIRKTELRPDVFNHIVPVSTSCRFTLVEQTVYSYKNRCQNIIAIIYSNK